MRLQGLSRWHERSHSPPPSALLWHLSSSSSSHERRQTHPSLELLYGKRQSSSHTLSPQHIYSSPRASSHAPAPPAPAHQHPHRQRSQIYPYRRACTRVLGGRSKPRTVTSSTRILARYREGHAHTLLSNVTLV